MREPVSGFGGRIPWHIGRGPLALHRPSANPPVGGNTQPERMNVTFTGVLDEIGKGFEKGLAWAVEYAVPVEKLVGLLFPAIAPQTTAVADATSLVQTAVLTIEQKFAAAGKQSGTGAQKLSEVLLIAQPVVLQLLQQAGITASSAYVQSLVNAVVAILNVQTTTAPASTSAPAMA